MLNPWYVTGFCDGEAAFTYSRIGGSFGLYFAIKQKEDNLQAIEEIQKFFNFVGNIYLNKDNSNSGKDKPPAKSAAYYRVTKANDLMVIVEHFDKYPLQSKKKHEIYSIWRKMVIHKIENYRNSDYNLLSSMAGELSSLNSQNRLIKENAR